VPRKKGEKSREVRKPKYPLPPPGSRFGYLEVLSEGPIISTGFTALCRCICGKEKPISLRQLHLQRRKSCGCRHNFYTEEARQEISKRSLELWSERRQEILEAQAEWRELEDRKKIPPKYKAYYRKLRQAGFSEDTSREEIRKLQQKETT